MNQSKTPSNAHELELNDRGKSTSTHTCLSDFVGYFKIIGNVVASEMFGVHGGGEWRRSRLSVDYCIQVRGSFFINSTNKANDLQIKISF